ncbi:MAG: hypothetical protein ABEJ30_06445 [Halorientalis sp.]
MSNPADGNPSEVAEQRVLGPVTAALRVTSSLAEETAAERDAFERFDDRVAAVEPVSLDAPSRVSPAFQRGPTPDRLDRVRSAYRETVMAVDHYEEVYGEPLAVHAASELSPELAAVLRPGTDRAFTRVFKRTLRTAVADAVAQREDFGATMRTERESLSTCREELAALVETDGRRGADVEQRLDAVARQRQATLATRRPLSGTSGHDLCQHCYDEYDWTYPVLTAVTRLRERFDGPAP